MGNRKAVFVAVAVLLAGALGLMAWSMLGLTAHTGEVCITFGGRTECRRASGATREDVIRTGTDMACAVLASGMTQRISCAATPPSRVTWDE